MNITGDLSVGQLAKKFGLSRSTLLYYDSIGLLSPRNHRRGEYRYYGDEEQKRLETICRYRQAGITLKDIKKILDSPDSSFVDVLHDRFTALNDEIAELRTQQRVIASLLQNSSMLTQAAPMNKELWVALLEASGFSQKDMFRWHRHFERTAPDLHLLFLRQLNIDEEEIERIRSL